MAEIKVKLIEAKEALENCIAIQDFDQASKLKEEIKTLEDARINLLKETEQLEIKEVHTEKVFVIFIINFNYYYINKPYFLEFVKLSECIYFGGSCDDTIN